MLLHVVFGFLGIFRVCGIGTRREEVAVERVEGLVGVETGFGVARSLGCGGLEEKQVAISRSNQLWCCTASSCLSIHYMFRNYY